MYNKSIPHSTQGDLKGKKMIGDFLCNQNFKVFFFTKKEETMDGYFVDGEGNYHLFDVKFNCQDLSKYRTLLCCSSSKLKAFQKYNIDHWYMVMVDCDNIYIKSVPKKFYENPIYNVKYWWLKDTEELGKPLKWGWYEKLSIPRKEFKQFKINQLKQKI